MSEPTPLERLTALIRENSAPPVSPKTMAAKIIAAGWDYDPARAELVRFRMFERISGWMKGERRP